MASNSNPNNQPPPNAYRNHAPPNLDLNLNLGQPLSAEEAYVRTPPRAAYQYRAEEDQDLTPVHPSFQRDGDFISSGPAPERGREPSIDESHRNFAYRAQPSMTSLNQSTSTTRGDDRDRDQFNPTPSQTNLHRVYTNESHHSREPLTTPHMDSQAAFQSSAVSSQSQQAPTIRPIKEADYGNPNHASPQLRQGGGFAYPPGQYQSIPLNDHTTGEKSGKRGIAWGGGERYSRNGTKEELDLSNNENNQNSVSSRGSRPQSRSRPSSVFRGAFGHMAGTGGTGTSTPRSEWEGFEFNPATAKKEELRYAEGDVGRSKFAKGYFYLLNKSIVTRWFLYIVPVLVLLWIPGIVWLAGVRSAKIWSVNLLWWSIWLTVVWGGWWAAVAAGMLVPKVLQATLVAIVPSMRQWIQIFSSLVRNVALILWTMAMWISFTPLVINHYTGDQAASSRSTLTLVANLLFGLFLCSLVIGAEKLVVQLIAYRFHQDSYEDRIRDQKLQIRSLVTLYINSTDIPGRRDTLTEADMNKKSRDPKKHIRKALKGIKNVAQNTTTALGNVATEISGQSVLQTNSPYNKVTAALASANKSKALARRLFYSFHREGSDVVLLRDIARFFPNEEAAEVAFAVFDRDENGDATRDEFDMAVIQIHREKLALEASMRDLDGAVRRLDDIFMVIVLVIVILIMAAMVTTKLTTLVTSAGTFVLGLSWLIGTTMQEIIGACIFLFVKHPFDVGDRVDFDGNSYVVASMQLMSTTFRRVDGSYTYIGNDILRAKLIQNIRRSGPISESFTFEVDFATDFKSLVELRDKMLIFLQENRRDYMPVFDVVVDSFPEQGKLVLKADIKYKTNWQEGALKVQRRNKWICALKNALADCRVYGPAGAGNPTPPPADPVAYTLVPYEPPAPGSSEARSLESPPPDFLAATAGAEHGAALLDQREVVNDASGDIFDDQVEFNDTNSGFATSAANTPGAAAALRHRRVPGESIEMAATSTRPRV